MFFPEVYFGTLCWICWLFGILSGLQISGARDLLQAPDLRLGPQDVQQDVSTLRANEVEVEVEQRDLGQAGHQGPRQAQQKVVRQARVPQDQLLHLVGRAQHRHHGVQLPGERTLSEYVSPKGHPFTRVSLTTGLQTVPGMVLCSVIPQPFFFSTTQESQFSPPQTERKCFATGPRKRRCALRV